MLGAAFGWRRVRWRVLRRFARMQKRVPMKLVARVGVPLLLFLLFLRSCTSGPTKAIEIGSGLRSEATVEARLTDGDWEECGYSTVTATYTCDQLLIAYDGMAALLNDARPSWGFNTPAIVASAFRDSVEMRVHVKARLDGTYWASASDTASLTVDGESPKDIDREILVYGQDESHELEIRGPIPTSSWQFTMVREDTIIPDRPFLAAPPTSPPASVLAIH
jgi:hypothetical protein